MIYLFKQTYEVLQALFDYIETYVFNKIGAAGGLATLNEDGKVPNSQIGIEQMTQAEASEGVVEDGRLISPKVLATTIAEKVSPVAGEVEALDERTDNINERLETVEQLAEISIGGGDIGIATAEDFNDPSAAQRAKVPTVGAILDCMDEVPTPNSVKPVQSGGVYYSTPTNENNSRNADLDFTDEDDNVLVEFADGHVKTKEFDSRGVNDKLNGIEAGAQQNDIDTNDDEEADLSFCDEDDNVLVKFANGHVKTKYFDSANVNIGYAREIINRYNGKVLSILGDSISTFGTPNQANAEGLWTYPNNRCRYPQSNLFTDVTKQYWYKLLNATGMTLGINESWAGSRVSNTASTDEGDVGPNRHIASMTRIGHLGENGTPDMILVYAGTNDVGHSVTIGTFNTESPINYTEEQIQALPVATFADAYRTMLIRLQYYYPSSEIVCCFPNYTTSYYDIAKLDRYNEIVREACDFFGVKYIDLRTAGITILNRATYLPDGIHPNAAGMQLLFKYIYKHIIFE